MCSGALMYTHTHTQRCTHTRTHTHTCTCTYIHIFMHTQKEVHTHVHIHTFTCTYIQAHTQTHIHMHTKTQKSQQMLRHHFVTVVFLAVPPLSISDLSLLLMHIKPHRDVGATLLGSTDVSVGVGNVKKQWVHRIGKLLSIKSQRFPHRIVSILSSQETDFYASFFPRLVQKKNMTNPTEKEEEEQNEMVT